MKADEGLVVIGNFDGVHRGHQAVLAAVSRLSRKRALQPKMLTFEPHPAVTLGRAAPALLTSIDRKLELVATASADGVIEISVQPVDGDGVNALGVGFERQDDAVSAVRIGTM